MRLVSSARYQLSRVVVSLSDRVNYLLKLIGFAIRYFPIRRRIAKIFPNVRFRTYWLASAWGEKRRLCLTDPFPCPVSMLPEDRESWQWQEVKAFRKGEKAIDEFFKTSGIPFSEQRRRQATPILLKANPKHFVISVSVTAGVLEVQDGRHRLAIATMAGLETINVQVVYPPLHQDRAMYREIKRWGGGGNGFSSPSHAPNTVKTDFFQIFKYTNHPYSLDAGSLGLPVGDWKTTRAFPLILRFQS